MSITETNRMVPRPVWLRHLRRTEGLPLEPPSEHEIHDAIKVLRDHPAWVEFDDAIESEFFVAWDPSNRRTQRIYAEALLAEAERIHAECSR